MPAAPVSNPSTPVLAGVAALQQQNPDFSSAKEAIELMIDACVQAADDAGSRELLTQCQRIAVPQGMWPYTDPARQIAEAIGAEKATSVLVKIGVLQQTAMTDACERIARGECDIAIVVGGEARYRALQAQIAGGEAPETVKPGVPDETMEPAAELWLEAETKAGLAMPVGFYALIESAYRYRKQLGVEQHRDRIAQLYSNFSRIACDNAAAWKREFVAADTIRNASPQNKMLAFPYTRLHNTSWNVDQAAALVFCSEKKARELGLDASRWVYPCASAESNHMLCVSQRSDISRSRGAEIGARAVLEAAAIKPSELKYADLYSCFPIAVELFADALNLPLDTPMTVTGGMPFAGGPLNNYVLQSTVALAQKLRADSGACGVVTSVSGLMTKQAYGVWSAQQPATGFKAVDVTDEVARADVAVPVLAAYDGDVTVIAGTVLLQGMSRAIVIGDTGDGRRVVLYSDDAALIDRLQREECCGLVATARGNQFTLQ
jgi:acetyl-CoA C-acetyltransferase